MNGVLYLIAMHFTFRARNGHKKIIPYFGKMVHVTVTQI
jgi:hypothetical protein